MEAWRRGGFTGGVAALALSLSLGAQTTPEPPLDQLLVRAGQHVEKLRTDLRVVIGDEHHTQTVRPNPHFVMDAVRQRSTWLDGFT